jgi:hypothetical protein
MEWTESFRAGKSDLNFTLLALSYPQVKRCLSIDSLY